MSFASFDFLYDCVENYLKSIDTIWSSLGTHFSLIYASVRLKPRGLAEQVDTVLQNLYRARHARYKNLRAGRSVPRGTALLCEQ